ncbi:MAG: hypothetical protein ABJZ69_13710 [Hyphomicrobiales bacterium]
MGVINGMMLGSLYVDLDVYGAEIKEGYSPPLPFFMLAGLSTLGIVYWTYKRNRINSGES